MRKYPDIPAVAQGLERPGNGKRSDGGVQSVIRALSLIDALGATRGEVGIADLSNRVGLHVSTVHRLLATLVRQGYCRQNPETSRYALGAKVFHLAETYLGQIDLRQVVRPFLERLSHETGETANLVILDGCDAVYLDKVESPQSLRIFSRIGRRAPLHCTAGGKILLAGHAWQDVERMLGRDSLERFTPRTTLSPEVLRRELEGVRAEDVALDREECEEGAVCIAAPVRNARGETVAAMSISGPTPRMHAERVRELTPIVVGMAREASTGLGYLGESGVVSGFAGNGDTEKEVRRVEGEQLMSRNRFTRTSRNAKREGILQARHAKRRRL